MLTYPTIVTGSVAQANMKISAVDGTAFIDFSNAVTPLRNYLNREIWIFDSSLRAINGWIKAAGTGETLGNELFDTWDNSSVHPFETFTPNGVDFVASNTVGTYGNAVTKASGYSTSGMLTKRVFSLVVSSVNGPTWRCGGPDRNADGALSKLSIDLPTGSYSIYATTPYSTWWDVIRVPTDYTVSFSETGYTLKQVLTPSVTGVTISSTPGGTENFASKHASFKYNDSSGYTYRILDSIKVV